MVVAGWTLGGRATPAVRHRFPRLAAAGLIGVGLVVSAAPAGAAVTCSYDPDTDIASLMLQKRDRLTIGRDSTNITAVYGAGASACASDVTVETVHSMDIGVDPVDNDDEQVTIDLAGGAFVNAPGTPDEHDIQFSIDLGDRGVDSLVIEGSNDVDDDIIVTGNVVNLNGNSQTDDVTVTGVENLEIRGNDGADTIDAETSALGAGQPAALSTSPGGNPPTANPGVTLVGGEGDDTLTGGGGNDTLVGNRGSDTLTGNLGDDLLDTGPGGGPLTGDGGTDTADFSGLFLPVNANLGESMATDDGGNEFPLDTVENVVGTQFADVLVGGDGPNVIECSGGEDDTYGMGGRDRIRGGSGDDVLHGGGSGDSLDGGDGDDILQGGGSGDGLGGGSGSDVIHSGGSGSGKDAVNSETGSDVIFGGPGRQVIFAGDGDDEVYGEAGSDLVDGQDGEDHVFGGTGSDTVRGGDGPDQVYGGSGSNRVSGGAGDDEVYGGSGSNGVSSSADGGAGDDVVFGGGHLSGGIGDDVLSAGSGSDHLTGGDGDDVLNAGSGSDLLVGQSGDDVLRGATGNDTVSFAGSRFGVAASLADGAASGEGEDALTGVENLWGSHFADSLAGDHLRNQLRGGGGTDKLVGGLGRDQESGEGGNDVLNEGSRRNGGDRLSGGAGRADVVDYSARHHRCRVSRDGSSNDGERGEHDNVRGDVERVRR